MSTGDKCKTNGKVELSKTLSSGNGKTDPRQLLQQLEDQVFAKIFATFKFYGKQNLAQLALQIREWQTLPERQKAYLPNHLEELHQKGTCINHNQQILNQILIDQRSRLNTACKLPPQQLEFDKISSQVFHQISREWSREGATQRDQSFAPIVNALKNLGDKVPIGEVLVPGCGLGRLCYDISKKTGRETVGNEHSFYMLWTSQFILTRLSDITSDADRMICYPWIHNKNNQRSFESSSRQVKFPDVNPADAGHLMAMYAGDFLEIFNKGGEYPAICTCFFIDTARNIIDYIEHIFHILRPGGYWINNGPLLFHFSDIKVGQKERQQYSQCTPSSSHPNEFYKTTGSVEYTLQEVHTIIEKVGFIFQDNTPTEIANVEYDTDAEALGNHTYKTSFWVCKKPDTPSTI